VNGEEVGSSGIATGDDEVGSDVALIAEQMLFQHGHDSNDARFAVGAESMQLHIGRDDGGGELGICGSTRTCTPDLGGDVVKFFAILGAVSLTSERSYVLSTNIPCQLR